MAFLIIIIVAVIIVMIVFVFKGDSNNNAVDVKQTLDSETVDNYISQHYAQKQKPAPPTKPIVQEREDYETGGKYSVEEDGMNYSVDSLSRSLRMLTASPLTFANRLNQLLASKNISTSEFYRNSTLSRQWLSNLTIKNVKPTKSNALASCIGLKLSLDEAEDLLKCAGYTFSNSDLTDLVVKCYLKYGVHNIDDVNAYLVSRNCNPIGSR